MPQGRFITFEGTEGGGKSTQIALLAERLRQLGHRVRPVREPGGTPIGEEIRHTLKHSAQNQAMTPETELLLMNASRAQLVREIVRPALNRFASGSRWKTLTKPDVDPKNVFTCCVSMLSCWTVAVTPMRSQG